MKNKKIVLLSIVGFLAVFIAATLLFNQKNNNTQNQVAKVSSSLLKKDHSFVLGNKDAKVEIVEFFDPACGACAYFHPYAKKVMKEHYPNIKMVFRYAPFHKNSDYAVKMLEAARQQDKFIEVLEYMYKTQNQWIQNHTVNPPLLYGLLSNTSLDMKQVANFLESTDVSKIINTDLNDAKKLNVTKTPTYYVNEKPLLKFDVESFKQLVQSEL